MRATKTGIYLKKKTGSGIFELSLTPNSANGKTTLNAYMYHENEFCFVLFFQPIQNVIM